MPKELTDEEAQALDNFRSSALDIFFKIIDRKPVTKEELVNPKNELLPWINGHKIRELSNADDTAGMLLLRAYQQIANGEIDEYLNGDIDSFLRNGGFAPGGKEVLRAEIDGFMTIAKSLSATHPTAEQQTTTGNGANYRTYLLKSRPNGEKCLWVTTVEGLDTGIEKFIISKAEKGKAETTVPSNLCDAVPRIVWDNTANSVEYIASLPDGTTDKTASWTLAKDERTGTTWNSSTPHIPFEEATTSRNPSVDLYMTIEPSIYNYLSYAISELSLDKNGNGKSINDLKTISYTMWQLISFIRTRDNYGEEAIPGVSVAEFDAARNQMGKDVIYLRKK